jgi:2-polyprenyl-3-methyl-5-hydroxy-6-metoxy-1,4-benzoquinol methylase
MNIQNRVRMALDLAITLMARRKAGETIEDFDIRGGLYALAKEIAPDARNEDIALMKEWIRPRQGEMACDLAAGAGFLTGALTSWLDTSVLAIDPSSMQLNHLKKVVPTADTVVMGSDDVDLLNQVTRTGFDLVTSFGGLHHAADHAQLMRNIDSLLKSGGRCVVGDIQEGSSLARHFDEVVAYKCLTGHEGITWWSESHIQRLCEGTNLRLARNELVQDHVWIFDSYEQLALFFRALHAYDLPDAEIIADLEDALGIREVAGKIQLSWPMYLFELIKL